jgi:NAD(P)-dependent dehydrogenase (short-subunit alcohol dehydrogenase family)
MELKGKNAIVTGGVSGLGRSIVERLRREQSNVVIFDIDPEGFNKMRIDLPDVSFYHCDVTNVEQVEQAVDSFYITFKCGVKYWRLISALFFI